MEHVRRISSGGTLAVLAIAGAALTAAIGLSLVATNPVALGPGLVTVWFVALWLALGCLATLAFYGGKRYLHLHEHATGRLRYSLRHGFVTAGCAVLILALASLKQLTWRDALLLVALALLFELYMRLRYR